MATQIAVTPPIVGKQAREVLKKLQTPPSDKAKKGAELLRKEFDGKIRW